VQNGGYINPPAIKRSNRDPYGWDHPTQRRNFGETVHEDDDILGTFTLHDYTHFTTAQASLGWAGFISFILGLTYIASWTKPEKPAWPKEYEDGLNWEMGGHGALRVL
jgi:NADH dehydrogenase (ubiquinone) 1 beta subcomplex subunit 8